MISSKEFIGLLLIIFGFIGFIGAVFYVIWDLSSRLRDTQKFLAELAIKHNSLSIDVNIINQSLVQVILGYNELVDKHNLLCKYVQEKGYGNNNYGEGEEWKRGYSGNDEDLNNN